MHCRAPTQGVFVSSQKEKKQKKGEVDSIKNFVIYVFVPLRCCEIESSAVCFHLCTVPWCVLHGGLQQPAKQRRQEHVGVLMWLFVDKLYFHNTSYQEKNFQLCKWAFIMTQVWVLNLLWNSDESGGKLNTHTFTQSSVSLSSITQDQASRLPLVQMKLHTTFF